MNSKLEALANDCAAHLQREESALVAMMDVLTTVRSALRAGDNARLADAADVQDHRANELHAVREGRHQLRDSIARVLGIDAAQATLMRAIQLTPQPRKSELLSQRARVEELARDTQRLMQSNLMVVAHGMQLMQQILCCLTGTEQSGTTYGPAGRPAYATPTSVFQTKC